MTVHGFARVLDRAAAASALDRLRVDPVAELAPPDHSLVRRHRRPAERVRYPVPALQLFVRRALRLDRGAPPLRVVRRHPRRHRPCLRALQPRQHLERDLHVPVAQPAVMRGMNSACVDLNAYGAYRDSLLLTIRRQ